MVLRGLLNGSDFSTGKAMTKFISAILDSHPEWWIGWKESTLGNGLLRKAHLWPTYVVRLRRKPLDWAYW